MPLKHRGIYYRKSTWFGGYQPIGEKYAKGPKIKGAHYKMKNRKRKGNTVVYIFYCRRTCRNPDCNAAIVEDTIIPVQCGAGLKLHADCRVGHKTTFSTCEHLNKNRTSILDIKLCVLQLVTGLSMSQECNDYQCVYCLLIMRRVEMLIRDSPTPLPLPQQSSFILPKHSVVSVSDTCLLEQRIQTSSVSGPNPCFKPAITF
jgi:hypothetical protein